MGCYITVHSTKLHVHHGSPSACYIVANLTIPRLSCHKLLASTFTTANVIHNENPSPGMNSAYVRSLACVLCIDCNCLYCNGDRWGRVFINIYRYCGDLFKGLKNPILTSFKYLLIRTHDKTIIFQFVKTGLRLRSRYRALLNCNWIL